MFTSTKTLCTLRTRNPIVGTFDYFENRSVLRLKAIEKVVVSTSSQIRLFSCEIYRVRCTTKAELLCMRLSIRNHSIHNKTKKAARHLTFIKLPEHTIQ